MKPSLHIASIALAGAWAYASCGLSPSPQNPSEDLSAIPTRNTSQVNPQIHIISWFHKILSS